MSSGPTTLTGHPAGSAPPGVLARVTAERSSGELSGQVLIERYELFECIGAGATGTVYRGFDRKRQRKVAVKVMHPRHARDQGFMAAFSREARAGERMIHPNLVQVYGYGDAGDGLLFIVMELLEGPTLERLLDKQPRPSRRWAMKVIAQVLSALDAAHDAGVIHRDVKPANLVLLRQPRGRRVPAADISDPHVKLCDFGVARIRRSSAALDSMRVDAGDTGPVGLLWGTPEYMAPEQAQGRSVDRRSDIYACGVMLYEMVTGKLPFLASSPQETARAHVQHEPVPPRELRPELSPELEEIILRAMAKDPAERFRNAQAMRSALLSLLGDEGGRHRAAPTVVFERSSDRPPPMPGAAPPPPPTGQPQRRKRERTTSWLDMSEALPLYPTRRLLAIGLGVVLAGAALLALLRACG
jgi:serine/threonine-protein kinase